MVITEQLIFMQIIIVFWTKDRYIPDLFMTAEEVHFLKAEIYSRGLGVAANASIAQTEYNTGVTLSVNFWTTMAINSPRWMRCKPTGLPDATTMNAFSCNPAGAFDAADAAHALQQIYGQEWIIMFRQPWDAWTLMKRTGRLRWILTMRLVILKLTATITGTSIRK